MLTDVLTADVLARFVAAVAAVRLSIAVPQFGDALRVVAATGELPVGTVGLARLQKHRKMD